MYLQFACWQKFTNLTALEPKIETKNAATKTYKIHISSEIIIMAQIQQQNDC